MPKAPEEVRREKSQAVLKALRERAVLRNAVRAEIREIHSKGGLALTEKMKGWRVWQKSEEVLNAAVAEFEQAEGIGDE